MTMIVIPVAIALAIVTAPAYVGGFAGVVPMSVVIFVGAVPSSVRLVVGR